MEISLLTVFMKQKNFTSGEGGALVINDKKDIIRSEIIREKGTNRSAFFRGQVDKYNWVDIGSSYLPSDILASFLFAQLEKRNEIQSKRKKIWNYYYKNLDDWAKNNKVKLPYIPDYCEQTHHMFYMLLPTLKVRSDFIKYMKSKNIACVFHYLPLNSSPMGSKFGWATGDCPVTENISNILVRLPFYNDLFKDIDYVIEAILNFKIDK